MEVRKLLIDAIPAPLVRLFASPYVAGESIDAAIAKADELYRSRGLWSTIDMLGESIENEEDARACRDRYLAIVDRLREREYCTVSLKPTSMGLNQGREACQENIKSVVAHAKSFGRGVTIDMEDLPTVDATLDIYRGLRQNYDNVGTVVQTKLFRTEDDIEALKDVGGRIRVCIGAYPEPAELAYTKKSAMKDALYRHTLRMLELGYYVEIATHDGALIDRILEAARKREVPRSQLEIQWLLGVPVEGLRRRYGEAGIRMRMYVPFCEQWKHATRYLKRRLYMNPHMLGYVLGNLVKSSA